MCPIKWEATIETSFLVSENFISSPQYNDDTMMIQ
jgi:hypothetical protein